jgi:hypothetical protein
LSFSFNLDRQKWSVIQPSPDSESPSGRLFHSAAVKGDALYLFGGTVGDNTRSGEIFRFQFSTYPKCTLHSDFGCLLTNKLFCDVTFIVGSEKKQVCAHASIVAARSSVLHEKIIEVRKSTKSVCVEVDLQEMKAEAFRIGLVFMYTDAIHTCFPAQLNEMTTDEMKLMMEVYSIAKLLGLRRLEQLCLYYIESSIGHRNVLLALQQAEEFKLNSIKEYCLKFIVKDINYREVVMSPQFEDLAKPLMVEVIRRREQPQTTSLPDHASAIHLDVGTSLETDLKSFLTEGIGDPFSDIVLVVDGSRIQAHKVTIYENKTTISSHIPVVHPCRQF